MTDITPPEATNHSNLPSLNADENQNTPQWDRTTRLVAAIMLVIAGLYAMTLITPVLQMLAFTFLLTFMMHAPANSLVQRIHIPWTLSVIVMYIVLILIILGSLLIVIPNVVAGTNALLSEGEQAYNDLRERLRDYTPDQGVATVLGVQVDFDSFLSPLRQFMLGDELNTPAEQAPTGEGEPATEGETAGEGAAAPLQDGTLLEPISFQQLLDGLTTVATQVTGTVTSAITSVTGFVGALLLAIFLSFLILVDWPKTRMNVYNWVTPAYRYEFGNLVRELLRVWNGFFRGQVAIGGIIGVITWLQLRIMGINGAEVLALLTGTISLIPSLGGIISLIPLGLTALLRGSTAFDTMPFWLVSLLVVGINMVLTQIIWNVVAPAILGDALDLPLPVIIVGVFIGTAVGGILGAFLVAPIMGTIRVLVDYVVHKIRQEDPYPPDTPAPQRATRRAKRT